jgi:hypothetical protein
VVVVVHDQVMTVGWQPSRVDAEVGEHKDSILEVVRGTQPRGSGDSIRRKRWYPLPALEPTPLRCSDDLREGPIAGVWPQLKACA